MGGKPAWSKKGGRRRRSKSKSKFKVPLSKMGANHSGLIREGGEILKKKKLRETTWGIDGETSDPKTPMGTKGEKAFTKGQKNFKENEFAVRRWNSSAPQSRTGRKGTENKLTYRGGLRERG